MLRFCLIYLQLGWEDGIRVLYVAATVNGLGSGSDNTYLNIPVISFTILRIPFNDTHFDSYIYAYETNSSVTTATSKKTTVKWTYPSQISARASNLGSITGAGALHINGTIM